MPAVRRFMRRFAVLALFALATEALSAGEEAAGADYFTLPPCRIYDTRPINDPLRGGMDRRRDVQVAGVCGVPSVATAVAVNLTAVGPSRAGSLAAYDADLSGATITTSILELSAGRNRANNAIIGLSAGGRIAAELSADFTTPADTVDLIVDIFGYFVPKERPTAVADEATVEEESEDNLIDVLANDTAPDGETKLVTAIDTTGTIGSVAITGGGSGISYVPASGYCNSTPGTSRDIFTYTITGGSTAQVAVSVLCTGIQIVKLTQGQDANSPPGPSVPIGGAVLWEYEVTNIGDVSLSEISVADDQGVTVACPRMSLEAGESMTCTGSEPAQACQYSNVGTVTGRTPGGETVSDDDSSHYFGGAPAQEGITIQTLTNGQDANTSPGPQIQAGDPVLWTYVIKNTGSSMLSSVRVTDSEGVTVFCPKSTLRPGESMTCTASGSAVACQYSNIGTVTVGTQCGSQDPSHYFGTPCP